MIGGRRVQYFMVHSIFSAKSNGSIRCFRGLIYATAMYIGPVVPPIKNYGVTNDHQKPLSPRRF